MYQPCNNRLPDISPAIPYQLSNLSLPLPSIDGTSALAYHEDGIATTTHINNQGSDTINHTTLAAVAQRGRLFVVCPQLGFIH